MIAIQPSPVDDAQVAAIDLRRVADQAAAIVPSGGPVGSGEIPCRVIDVDLTAEVDLTADVPRAATDTDSALQPFRIARPLTSPGEILQARRLHAAVYLRRGFVTTGDLGPDGTIAADADPWSGLSSYFGASRDGVLTATARQIAHTARGLPTLDLPGLTAEAVRRIDAVPAETVVEISALASRRRARSSDVVSVYARMWQESSERGHRVWLMAVDRLLFTYLTRFLCGSALRPIGPDQVYMGSVVVPAVLWCDEVGAELRRMAASARNRRSLPGLLPQLFPDPAVVSV